jgi:hypothetical protein
MLDLHVIHGVDHNFRVRDRSEYVGLIKALLIDGSDVIGAVSEVRSSASLNWDQAYVHPTTLGEAILNGRDCLLDRKLSTKPVYGGRR